MLRAILFLLVSSAVSFAAENPLLQRRWFEARTAHFNILSCGGTQEVSRVAARLEQFREAYAMLAGGQAVASPPIVAIAFPDRATMQPFLPLYQGQPANLAAFFRRGSDENFIALYLSGAGAGSLESIFHEYTHLLLRHNQLFWPIWLNEGMAEIYSTFELDSTGAIQVGKPLDHYLQLLSGQPLMPLSKLFGVTHDSPEYNERERQGIFYAESWLLTHYLMVGDSAANKMHFGQLTTLLRLGQSPEQAFTNAFGVSARQMEVQLQRYLERGRFASMRFAGSARLSAGVPLALRPVYPVETACRLGDMLMRVNRLGDAERYFEQARKLGPKNPLPFEWLGLLAAERSDSQEAIQRLREAMKLGQVGFLAHYTYAHERFRQTSKTEGTFTRVSPRIAEEIESELQKSLALMPDFGPAQELSGFFLMVQDEDLPLAEQHLQRAIQLEPENQSYLFSLAQLQWRRKNLDGARQTLEPLRLSYTDAGLRAQAEKMLRQISREAGQ